mmetsp:Transcript_17540/g.31646  ORF Transcript_17540/g.31646 Transcript_17540/m.31646 type:complete len:265 (-) Transcript_17540:25-819(-)
MDTFAVPYTRDLQLKVLELNKTLSNEFRVNDIFNIKPTGFVGSRRYTADRTVRFGRFDGSRNDINVNPEDIEISRDMFQIICNSDGYYILDSANIGATSLKLLPETNFKLTKGTLFNIGKNILVNVLEITEFENSLGVGRRHTIGSFDEEACPTMKLEIVKGEALGKIFEFKTSPRTFEFLIGHKAPTKPKDMEFMDPQVSRMHAKICFTFNGWHLTDLNSKNGTWICLINYDNVSKNIVTPPVKLKEGDIIGACSYFFECLSC